MSESKNLSEDIDSETKENIARALWMREYVPKNIPADVLSKLGDRKNSRTAFGEKM